MHDPTPRPDATETLAALPRGRVATIARIEWDALGEKQARRMRELGFDEGVAVEALHVGPLGRDPIAIRVGRMMIAMRRAQAAAVLVHGASPDALDGLAIAAE